MTIPIVRKRAKRPKVKTGCRTCRARHVKCGEERPGCQRCEKAGRVCEGYDAPKKGQSTESMLALLPNDHTWNVPIPQLDILAGCLQSMSSLEGYALDYFRREAMRELPGSNWLLSWDKIILPFCRSEPALLHAATAIGALQRTVDSDVSGATGGDEFALTQYSKSVSLLRSSIEFSMKNGSAAEVETILTGCLLLFCFEVLRGEDTAASVHLQNGLRILQRQLNPDHGNSHRQVELQASPRSRLEILTKTFCRLDSDLTLLICDDAYLYPICNEAIPTYYQTLDEAMVHMDALEREIHEIGSTLDKMAEEALAVTEPGFPNLDSEARDLWTIAYSRIVPIDDSHEIFTRITEARQRLESITAALPTTSDPDEGRCIIEVHIFHLWFTAFAFRDRTEMECDRFETMYESTLDRIERICAMERRPNSLTIRPAFAHGSSVVGVLCMIVEKCRKSLIRRRGIELLRTIDLRGAYDAQFLASWLECAVDTEERLAREALGLPDDYLFHWNEIPIEARFFETDCGGVDIFDDAYYKSDVGRLVYARPRPGVEGELDFGETVFSVKRDKEPVEGDLLVTKRASNWCPF